MIGIDASRAFLARRTGIEEYAYRLISNLRGPLRDERVILYVRKTVRLDGGRPRFVSQETGFDLPPSWEVRALFAPRFFTQGRLSLEMLFRRPDVLLVPAHTVPFIRPRRTVVVVHGLEYETSEESYSTWERFYLRHSIRCSVRWADRIVAVSESTKRDLVRLYGVPEGKMRVIYEGKPVSNGISYRKYRRGESGKRGQWSDIEKPYLLFVGRIEERKNIRRTVEAFEILKSRHGIPHRLVLVGKPGYGYERVRERIDGSACRTDIVETGYVSDEEKAGLLRDADIFIFPSLYEGFGLPVVEAQEAGVPVVTSDTSSLPEVAGDGAVFVDPADPESIAEGIWRILSDTAFRDDIIGRGRKNAERFDWGRCAEEVATLLSPAERIR